MWKWGATTGIRGAGILPPERGDWFNHVTVCTGGRNGKCLASSSPPLTSLLCLVFSVFETRKTFNFVLPRYYPVLPVSARRSSHQLPSLSI